MPSFRRSDDSPAEEPPPFQDLPPHAALALWRERQATLCLIDVRTLPEHASHRIPGSRTIPLQDLAGRLAELDPQRPTLVYCEHGIRSIRAAVLLATAGFDRVYNLRGGIVQWPGELEGTDCQRPGTGQ